MDRLSRLLELQKEDPKNSFLAFAIAKEYEKRDQLDIAIQTFLSLIERDPNYVGTYFHLAKLYEKIDDEEQAMKTYEKGIKIAQKLGDTHALSELQNAKINLELSA